MLPPSDLAIHRPIARQSALIPSPSLELFFLVLLVVIRQPQRAASSQPWQTSLAFTEEHASHTEEPALWSVTRATRYSDTPTHTLPTNSRTNTLTGDTFSLLLFYTCHYNKPFVVVFSKEVSLFICVVK